MRPVGDGERWIVLGLAGPRTEWFTDVSRWANASAVPIDFLKCVSVDEVVARLDSGRVYSALLVDARLPCLDRDLIDACRSTGTVVVVVGDDGREWVALGASAILPARLVQDDLVAALHEHARPVADIPSSVPELVEETYPTWHGRLIAVTGPGGAGSSLTAMATAQQLAEHASNRGLVLLADMALSADQAMLHDSGTVLPGLQELVEGHRREPLTTDLIRQLVFDVEERGYHLLLGLRRHRDWTAVRPRALVAALAGLRRSYRVVVADVDADLEGERETGSVDLEDRNLIARTVVPDADLVVVVGRSDLHGLHTLVRTIGLLLEGGLESQRLLIALNRAPRSPRIRASLTTTVMRLLASTGGADRLDHPVFIPARRDVEAALRDGSRLPAALGRELGREIGRRLRVETMEPPHPVGPERVAIGSIGHWTEPTS